MKYDYKKQQAKQNLELFNELIQTEKIWDTNTNNTYTPHSDEVFRQCWKNNKARKYYPTMWFLSNYGNLVSIKEGKLVMLYKRRNGKNCDGYFYVEFKKPGKKSNTKDFIHIMVALVFDVQSYGRARKLIKSKGLEAFGIYHNDKRKRYTVQCHHKNGNIEDNRAKNLELLTAEIHNDVLHKIDGKSSNEELAEYLTKINKEVEKENVSAIVIGTGEGYNAVTKEPIKADKFIETIVNPNGNETVINLNRLIDTYFNGACIFDYNPKSCNIK